MSVQTLYTAATGMEALETKLDVIANNMANINTTAFKKDRANFEDLFYRQYRLPGAQDADGGITSTGIEVGLGTRVSSTQTNHGQGCHADDQQSAGFGYRRRRILPGQYGQWAVLHPSWQLWRGCQWATCAGFRDSRLGSRPARSPSPRMR